MKLSLSTRVTEWVPLKPLGVALLMVTESPLAKPWLTARARAVVPGCTAVGLPPETALRVAVSG